MLHKHTVERSSLRWSQQNKNILFYKFVCKSLYESTLLYERCADMWAWFWLVDTLVNTCTNKDLRSHVPRGQFGDVQKFIKQRFFSKIMEGSFCYCSGICLARISRWITRHCLSTEVTNMTPRPYLRYCTNAKTDQIFKAFGALQEFFWPHQLYF